jgi:hypothetical protein
MDEYIQNLLREYALSPTDELAHRITHAMLRTRTPIAPQPQPQPAWEDTDWEEEEEEEEDEALRAAQDAGEVWGCCNCGRDDLYVGNQDEIWALLTPAAAAVTDAKISSGAGGEAMCEECLLEAGLDLDEAVQDELEDYCSTCGEMEQDCYCQCDECGENEEDCEC